MRADTVGEGGPREALKATRRPLDITLRREATRGSQLG